MRDIGVIENGSVLIEDGVIHSAGPSRRIENLRETRIAPDIDASGCVVMPGFIDGHVSLTPGAWSAQTTIHRLSAEARARLRRLVEHGVTYAESRTGDAKALRALDAIRREGAPIGSRIALGGGIADFRGRRLPGAVDGPPEMGAELRRARAAGLRVRVESAEGGVADALECGASSIDGLTAAAPREVELMAHSDLVLTLLPGRVFHAGSDAYPDARAWIDRGVAVALATGFDHESCPCLSMPLIAAMAAARMKLTAAETITACTVNAAWPAGIGDRAGSLMAGKQADLVILEVGDYREFSHHFGWNPVRAVVKSGVVIWRRDAGSGEDPV